MDPFKVSIDVSTTSTADPLAHETQVDLVPTSSHSSKASNPTSGLPAEGAKVSAHTKKKSDTLDASTSET